MKYEGQAIQTVPLDGGFVELRFDLKGDSVNKFNALTMGELREVVEGLTKAPPKGLLVTSGKDVFIVGADVTEFLDHFQKSEEELTAWLLAADAVFNGLEDLPCPSVVALNGFCLGGGFELALACSLLFADDSARFAVPEIQLGVFPPVAAVLLPALGAAMLGQRLVLSGETVDADALAGCGLLAGRGDSAEAAVSAWIEQHLLPRSASSLRIAHRAARAAVLAQFRAHIGAAERLYLDELMATHDANEGIAAFIAKRPPVWAQQ